MVFQPTSITDRPLLDENAEEALGKFKGMVEDAFGDRLNQIFLYGSQARGQATPDSDLDILVVLDPLNDGSEDWNRCIDFTAEIAAQTGELISVLVTSLSDYNNRGHPLLINIRKEGIPLL